VDDSIIFDPVNVPSIAQLKNHERDVNVALHLFLERTGLFEDRAVEYLTADLRSRRAKTSFPPRSNNGTSDEMIENESSTAVNALLFNNTKLNFGNVENIPENVLKEVPLLHEAYSTLGKPLSDEKISEIFTSSKNHYDVKGKLEGIINIMHTSLFLMPDMTFVNK
jgi:hypothetical protein